MVNAIDHRTANLCSTTAVSIAANALSQQLKQELGLVRSMMRESLGAADASPAVAASIYHLETGGSYLRARLALLSGIAYGASPAHRIAAAASAELLHNASLVHDDLCDRDISRRGRPTVWYRHGAAVALCSGDLLLTAAFRVALRSDQPDHCLALLSLLSDRASQIIAGQSIEVAPSCSREGVTFKDYRQATLAKTAPLIMLPLEAGAIGGEISAEQQLLLRHFANAVGLSYQIIDDLDDLEIGSAPTTTRTFHRYHALSWHCAAAGMSTGIGLRKGMLRALRHAEVALKRANRLQAYFPQVLAEDLDSVLGALRKRLSKHQTVINEYSWEKVCR